jgi:hypothetical protein
MSGNPRTPLGSPPAPGPAGRELIRGRFLEPPRPPEGGLAPQTPDLKPGQALKALVLGLQPDGQVLIRLLGRTLLAQSQTPLSPGQSLEVVVRQTSPQLMLSLLEPPGPAPGGLAVALQEAARGRQRLLSSLHVLLGPGPPATGDARLADMASRLRQVAQGMLAQEGSGPDAGLLPRQARLSGLDLEARLALLALGRQVELPDSPRTLVPALLARLAPAQEGQKDQALARAWKEFGQAAQELLEH